MITAARLRAGLPRPPLLWLIGGAWGLAVLAHVTGSESGLHHHRLAEGGLPLGAALGLFLVAWQLHVAAMMLPSSLPLITLFRRAAAAQPNPGRVEAAFLAGYAAVWGGFGALAFAGDSVIHWGVHRWGWLAGRSWLIGGGVLVLAGLFQYSGLKERCLKECRHPAAYLLKHYRRGVPAAFRMGRDHGLFCLGCCWGLMLVMFAAGIANLAWMAPLALVMFFEKTGPGGERAVVPIGVGLLVLGGLVLAHPAWLPPLFAPEGLS